jgi:hypothetical protein
MAPPKQAPKPSLKRPHPAPDKAPSSNADGSPPRKILKLKVNSFKVEQIQRSSPNPGSHQRAQPTATRSSPVPRLSPPLVVHPAYGQPLNPSASPAPAPAPATSSTPAPGPIVVKARKPLPDSAPTPPPPLVRKPSIVLKLKTNPKPS